MKGSVNEKRKSVILLLSIGIQESIALTVIAA
jgi:hypothetical protein